MDFNLVFAGYDLPMVMKYPLGVLWTQGASGLGEFSMFDLFVGKEVGGIGCSSDLLLLLGGVSLILMGEISWRIPVCFLLGIALTSSVFWLADSGRYASPLFHVLAGNAMIGAFFLAPDYSSSPVGKWAMMLYGFGCGSFAVLLRVWSAHPDGTFFAILLINIMSPLLDMFKARRQAQSVVTI